MNAFTTMFLATVAVYKPVTYLRVPILPTVPAIRVSRKADYKMIYNP